MGLDRSSLLLDTEVDPHVGFTALSVLSRVDRSNSTMDARRGSLPRLPVAGSEGWLSSMVEVGRQEALLRDSANERIHDVDKIGDEVSDAFFAVDVECVLHKYRRWHECFPRVKPFYAVKCNPNSEVVRVLASTPGCGFDCASPAEMDQVLECGVDPSRIIYANPCKDMAALEHAFSAGIATMTFDSKDELYKIRQLLDLREKATPASVRAAVQMVLRLRVPDSYSDCPLGEKYGAAEAACSELITLAVELGLPLVGVSFHCGSGCQNAQAYPEALIVAKSLFDLAARQGATLTLLDIGGGFPGWDGSECVYDRQPIPHDLVPGATDAPAAAAASTASTGAVGQSLPCHKNTERASDDRGAHVSPAPGDGGLGHGLEQLGANVVSVPTATPPPLSLAEIARVTLPVLDALFPSSSGVQVIAEPGRYFVEASHVLFARIYAKRCLSLQVGTGDKSEVGDDTTVGNGKGKKTTAYFIDEGVNGCFKDKVLCGVNFEPCPVTVSAGRRMRRGPSAPATAPTASAAQTGADKEGRSGHHGRGREQSGPAYEEQTGGEPEEDEQSRTAAEASRGREIGADDGEEEEDSVVMGPSGLPADVVARKRLPKSLKPGDWLYFSRMGAYTASIATVTSSAVLETSYCYVASTPATTGAIVCPPGDHSRPLDA
ncbi:unnamed protein product [Scytosiphon promiscuus]